MNELFTDKLFANENAYDFSAENIELLTNSMKEMAQYHIENSQIFRGICEQHYFSPDSIKSKDDLMKIPHIFVTAFKQRKMLSVPESEIMQTFTSSGTQGQMSQINLDEISFNRQKHMRESIVKAQGLTSGDKVNYIVFSYDPAIAGSKGAAHTFQVYASFAPTEKKYFALKGTPEGESAFDLEESIKTIVSYAETGLPIRVVGFLAFSFVTFKEMNKRGIHLKFPAESLLLTGGGWKSHTGETVSYDEYADLVNKVLGITPDRIRDFYGMVEHGVPYMSCSHRNFHVPIYANVATIDPGTLKVLPKGEIGLLKLQTSYIRSAPGISVLSTDLGEIQSNCPCGLHGDYIVLRGRAGVTKHAGCAISASQLIRV